MADEIWQEWFENAWAVREEGIYRSLFGDIGSGIYPLDIELFRGQFRQTSVDPRWLTHGVFESRPNESRASWLYVSSGLSNAWEANPAKPHEVSGLGCEFIIEPITIKVGAASATSYGRVSDTTIRWKI